MRKISVVIVIIAIISSFFFKMETTTSRKTDLEEVGITDQIQMAMIKNNFDMIAYYVSNMPDKYHENNNLSFMDGIKNGALVIASYARDVMVGFVCDYLSGFNNKGIIMKIIWGICGLFIESIKNVVVGFFGTIVLVFKLLFQKGSISYYIGYIVALFLSLGILGKAVEE